MYVPFGVEGGRYPAVSASQKHDPVPPSQPPSPPPRPPDSEGEGPLCPSPKNASTPPCDAGSATP